jgi:pectinesterase
MTVVCVFLAGCSKLSDKPPASAADIKGKYDAVVDGSYSGNNGDTVKGIKMFRTVQSAVDSAPIGKSVPYVIYVKKGIYREKVTVHKPYVTLLGEDEAQTVISYGATAGMKREGDSSYGTAGSATVSIFGSHFTAENLSIINSFDYFANMAKADNDPAKISGTQAVALLTDAFSDHAMFKHITLSSYQDTLYANEGTQYYEDCIIKGGVDFIFGGGQAVFNKCDIISLDRKSTMNNGYITAASTNPGYKYGFLIINSRLLKSEKSMTDGTVALGRPWHPGGKANVKPAVAYIHTFMDAHISATGWDSMSGFSPQDARFYEYGSTGPGARKSDARRVLSANEAESYSIRNVLNGWDPTANQ